MAAVDRNLELSAKQLIAICSEPVVVPAERHMDGLMERLQSKVSQFKSWTENAKAVRVALVDKRYVLDATDRSQLQKCLDTLQKSIKVTSLQSMVERLDSISRQLGLKFTAGPSGTDCFISSDMFYVEVLLETTGAVNDVKIAHHGDPLSCPELHQVLSKGDFAEFTEHLEGLSSIYQMNADKKQKSKAYMALQALETDLTMLSQLQSSINDPCNLVHKSPVGILQTRRGGHAMKLTYFISPYDLLDLQSKTLIPLTVDAVIEKQLGYSVMVCIESSASHKLQTQSLMSIARTVDGKSLPSFAAPTNLNSTTLPANFVLRLHKAMPLATPLIRKIQAVTHIDCADLSTSQPLLSLITIQESDGEIGSHSRGLFVTLPDQHHCYFLNGVSDLQGVLVSSIPFTHPTHVPQILIFLRQQALFNVLIGSCIRPCSKQDLESALMFEVSALSWLHVTVAFEHPLEESMATAELDLSDITNVKCKLHTMPNDLPICADEYASKVVQRCLSIPITMRALIRKAQASQHQPYSIKQQPNGDQHNMGVNLMPNNGGGAGSGGGGSGSASGSGSGSSFSGSGGGGNSNGSSGSSGNGNGTSGVGSSKFATDFEVKVPKLSESDDDDDENSASDVPSLGSASEAVGLPSATATTSSTATAAAAASSAGVTRAQSAPPPPPPTDLFSVPSERAGSLKNMGLLGNSQLSQTVPQPQQQQQQQQRIQQAISQQVSQGKPNTMLMNLLNDVPQALSMTGSSGSGGSGSSASLKSRKQRKRKAVAAGPSDPTSGNSPRGSTSGGMPGRSPKQRPSAEDESSSLDFTAKSKDFAMPSSDIDSNNETSTEPPSAEMSVAPSTMLPSSSSLEFQIKSEPMDVATDDVITGGGGGISPAFTISNSSGGGGGGAYGSTIKLSASSSPDQRSINKSSSSSSKQKRNKMEMTTTSSALAPMPIAISASKEREIPLGKEIEKIPIVLDITSGCVGCESGALTTATTTTAKALDAMSHAPLVVVDRRPSVEIIPLGMGTTVPPPLPLTSSPSSAALVHSSVVTCGGMTMFSTSMKIAKSVDSAIRKESGCGAGGIVSTPGSAVSRANKQQQREIRRSASEIIGRKMKSLDGKKDRKRKRVDSVDGILLDGGSKPPKIISVITPLPTSSGTTAGSSLVTAVATTTTSVAAVAHKLLDGPLTLNVKPALGSGSPSISVSVTKTAVTPTTTTKKSAAAAATAAASPTSTAAATLPTASSSSSSPSKSISILKPTSAASSTTKATLGKLIGAPMRMSEMQSKMAALSPLKMQNKNKPLTSLSRNNAIGGVATATTTAAAAKVPTKPATVKLKQLNLSSVVSAAAASSSVARMSGSGGGGNISSRNPSAAAAAAAAAAMATVVSMSQMASGCNPVTSGSSQCLLTAAQRASKLLARSKKASLSSVIDKLSMQLQHTGGELIPIGTEATMATIPTSSAAKVQKTAASAALASSATLDGTKTGSMTTTTTTGGVVSTAVGPTTTTASDVKKAEFTVKSSSQGIKLTVTKTHVSSAECVKLSAATTTSATTSKSGSASGTSSSSSRKTTNSPNSLSKIGGSATGLKPGVNSGPASKKNAVPTIAAASPVVTGTKSSPPLPSPSSMAISSSSSSQGQSAPSPVTVSQSKSPTTTTSTSSAPTSSSSMVMMMPSKNSSGGTASPKVTGTKMGQSVSATSPKQSKVFKQGSEGMPPPPPPPPPTASTTGLTAVLPDVTLQPIKRLDEVSAPQHVAPLIRPFPKLPRESLLEENEAERAFQRLLQAQSISGAFTKVTAAAGGPLSSSSSSNAATDGPRTPKSVEQLPDRSPKSDGRNTPITVLAYEQRVATSSPGLVGMVKSGGENKGPPTPKLTDASASPSVCSDVAVPATSLKVRQPSCSPVLKDSSSSRGSSPEDGLVIDCPSTPLQKNSPNRLPATRPSSSLNAATVAVDVKSILADVRLPASPLSIVQQAATPTTTMTMTSAGSKSQSPAAPVQQQQPSPVAVPHTPLSEHSNPSSVAHSSPYDIDDDLMDEALVGLGK